MRARCRVARRARRRRGAPVGVTREFERTPGADVYEGYGRPSSGCHDHLPGQFGGRFRQHAVGRRHGLRIVSLEATCSPLARSERSVPGGSLISGYWRADDPAAPSPGDWLATGDLGYVDDDGYLFLVDRLKEMIIRSGYSVYPRGSRRRSIGIRLSGRGGGDRHAHPTLGEVVALVVPKDARRGRRGDRSWVREQVAAYKYPRHVVVVDELPKGRRKILKRAIDREGSGLLASNPA